MTYFVNFGAVDLAVDRRNQPTVSGPNRIPRPLAFIFFAFFELLCDPFWTCAQSYTSAREFLSGGSPSAVAVGDFNHDGKEDVVIANFGTTISVLLGNGDGTFQAPVNYPIGTVTLADIAAADFNGDGKLDLAVTDRSGTLNILLGNGDGTFQPAVSSNLGTSSAGIVVADFNEDQHVDIALLFGDPTSFAGKVLILLGNGDGTFKSMATFDAGGSLNSAVVGDFNGDGKPDLAVANTTGVSASRGTGDLVVFLGNGDGTFVKGTSWIGSGSAIHRLLVADFNGDGKQDLALMTEESGGVRIILGNGDGTFQSPALLPQNTPFPADVSMASADLNGDGKPDLLVTLSEIQSNETMPIAFVPVLDVQLGKGDGTFQPPLHFTLPSNDSFIVTAKDLNGDGLLDIIVTDPNGIEVLKNNTLLGGSDVAVALGQEQQSFLQKLLYSVGANNRGPGPANNVVVTDILPTGSALLSLDSACVGTTQITCTFGSLPAGGFIAANVVIWTPPNGGTIVDSASVAANESDPDTTNNSASVTTVAYPGSPIVTVSVSKAGNGGGVVNGGSTIGIRINCGSSCSQNDVGADTVILTATANAGSSFTSWSGACTGTDPSNCRFIVGGSPMVTATFSLQDFSLSSANPSVSTTRGTLATNSITVTPQNGFSGSVALSCSVAGPTPLPCSVSPSTVSSGATLSSATVTVDTSSATAQLIPETPYASFPGFFSFAVVIVFTLFGLLLDARLRLNQLPASRVYVGLALLSVLFLSACGGHATKPAENFTVTVTATSGSLSHVVHFSLALH
jgi:uncharacterized repeat protein (TIGR01451 family)